MGVSAGTHRRPDVAVAVIYWVIAELTLLPATSAGRVTPMWPAAGVAVAAMLLRGRGLIPGIAAGAFITTSLHMSIPAAFAIALGIVLEALNDVRLLQRFEFDERLERVRDPLILSAVSLVGAAVAGVLGMLAIVVNGTAAPEPLVAFVLWWMRDWIGVQLVVALVATWARSRRLDWTWPRLAEAIALLFVLALLSQLMFGLWSIFPGQNVPMAFLLFPVVGYTGLRFGPSGAATVVAIVAAFALPIAALGLGPFAQFPIGVTQFLLHTFLLFGWLSGQTLAALMSEREEALRRHMALEEQLRHSQKMEAVGRLVGGIAHDFNNLLTAILGYTEMVMVSLEPGDPRRGDTEEIARAAMRAADLTRQMLAFSRKQVLQPEVIDLNVTLSKVEPMLRRVIGEDIVMTIAAKATAALVRVDPGQIEQVIMNLVVNARDAMPRGGRLTVETSDVRLDASALPPDTKPGMYALLAVSDTGVGMPADVRARIFEPYFTTKDIGKGTGLGLSTAHGIIRQSDGHIQVYSEPGLGTTFRIYLPRSEAAATVEAPVDENMPRGTEHILLVEDDPSVRRMSREILERLGYSITEAASGRAGLALGSDDTRHFDLAFCDVILGDISGPAVYEALRALRPSVRVLYMSGYVDEAIVRTGVLDEGHPFLQKPFTPRDLAVKLREVLDRKEDE
ncbi:MAG: MASE1 domain-containing protein [Acidobacteria bacterium]|nr:MASE1 domain-containing protein [Acidobacteriota bacterium]